MRTPELLSPAGDFEKLKLAVAYGADAVYLAGSEFGMRASAGNFSAEELGDAVAYAKSRGVRAYLTLNTIPHPAELPRLLDVIKTLPSLGIDAVIVADAGVFSMVRTHAPSLPVHMSTQAGVTNAASANFWHGLGASRVILARELTIGDIRAIRGETPPDLELECFVHGSMCVSFSGRCLLSNYLTGRDANRGACAQACRFKYYLREEKRGDDLYEIVEDREGAYILNSKDLCAISFLSELRDAGVSSFKIEGRSKSSYYAAVTTNAYRLAIDALVADRPFDPALVDELKKTSHRALSDGFFHGDPESVLSETAHSGYIRDWDVVAIVEQIGADGTARLLQKNRVKRGATVELLSPGAPPVSFTLSRLTDESGAEIPAAIHPHMRFFATLPEGAAPFSILRAPRNADAPSVGQGGAPHA